MSNSKKNWNAGKAEKRAAQANKKSLKVNAQEAKALKKRIFKVK
jgi:hypothetical protein